MYYTWLQATKSDLRPLNIGPSYAWKMAASQQQSFDWKKASGHSVSVVHLTGTLYLKQSVPPLIPYFLKRILDLLF